MIALLCPTYKRMNQVKRMIESAEDTAGEINIYLGFSADDLVARYLPHKNNILFPANLPTVYKWNALANIAMQNTKNDLFMLCADDVIFSTPGWDNIKKESRPHVYHFQDSRDSQGTPHPIVNREYINHMGYFVPPIFLHWFVDSWTVAIARTNNCFTHLKDYLLIHDKPSDHGKADETHNRIREWGWHDRDKYVNDTCQHFLNLEKQRLGEAFI